jgi:hypothetical protein
MRRELMLRLNFALMLAVALFGTVDPLNADVSSWHEPLFGGAGRMIHIKARANHPGGIRKITTTIVVGKIVSCGEIRPWAKKVGVPCRTGASRFIHECEYSDYAPPSAEVACEYSEDFSSSYEGKALVSYRVEATTRLGDVLSDQEITFSQGDPSAQNIARPIWWYRLAPLRSKLDIGFFPDQDYDSNYYNFANDLSRLLAGTLFVSAPFAYPYQASKLTFNFWAASFGADAEKCDRSFAEHLDPVVKQMDGRVVLHQLPFTDCASVSLSGYGSVSAKSDKASAIFAHEMGHFLYGQGDEYCEGGTHETVGSCMNIFPSFLDCVAYATLWELDYGDCEEMGCGNMFRLGRGSSIMKDVDLTADWHVGNRRCVQDRIVNCESGVCYVRSFF